MFRNLVFLILLFLSSSYVHAQAKMEFTERYINLDTLSINDTLAVCNAKFVNTGNAPLYLISGESYCPCTTFEIVNKEAVSPRDTSYVTIKFVPNHFGDFKHSVLFKFFNEETEEDSSMVTIYGYVKEE